MMDEASSARGSISRAHGSGPMGSPSGNGKLKGTAASCLLVFVGVVVIVTLVVALFISDSAAISGVENGAKQGGVMMEDEGVAGGAAAYMSMQRRIKRGTPHKSAFSLRKFGAGDAVGLMSASKCTDGGAADAIAAQAGILVGREKRGPVRELSPADKDLVSRYAKGATNILEWDAKPKLLFATEEISGKHFSIQSTTPPCDDMSPLAKNLIDAKKLKMICVDFSHQQTQIPSPSSTASSQAPVVMDDHAVSPAGEQLTAELKYVVAANDLMAEEFLTFSNSDFKVDIVYVGEVPVSPMLPLLYALRYTDSSSIFLVNHFWSYAMAQTLAIQYFDIIDGAIYPNFDEEVVHIVVMRPKPNIPPLAKMYSWSLIDPHYEHTLSTTEHTTPHAPRSGTATRTKINQSVGSQPMPTTSHTADIGHATVAAPPTGQSVNPHTTHDGDRQSVGNAQVEPPSSEHRQSMPSSTSLSSSPAVPRPGNPKTDAAVTSTPVDGAATEKVSQVISG